MRAGLLSRRIHLLVLALILAPAFVVGAPVLRPPGSGAFASVVDFRRNHVVTETSVDPAPRVTLLLLLDTLSEADLKPLQPAILKLQRDAAGKVELRIALLGDGSIQFAGPFSSPSRLRAAWREIPATRRTVPGYSGIRGRPRWPDRCGCPSLGAGWSHVLLIGRIPEISPAAEAYALARALNTFSTRRIRLSTLSMDPTGAGFLAATVAATAGVSVPSLDEFLGALSAAGGQYLELTWGCYMLAYSPPGEVTAWHRIELIVKGQKQVRVRAKEGYSAD